MRIKNQTIRIVHNGATAEQFTDFIAAFIHKACTQVIDGKLIAEAIEAFEGPKK